MREDDGDSKWRTVAKHVRSLKEGFASGGDKNAVTVEHERLRHEHHRETTRAFDAAHALDDNHDDVDLEDFTEAIARPHTAMMHAASDSRCEVCRELARDALAHVKSSGGPLSETIALARVRRQCGGELPPILVRHAPSSPRRSRVTRDAQTLKRRARGRRRTRGRPPRAQIGSRVRPSGTRWEECDVQFRSRGDAPRMRDSVAGGGGRHRRGGDRDGTPRIRQHRRVRVRPKKHRRGTEKRVRVKRRRLPRLVVRETPRSRRQESGRGRG